MLEVDKIRNRFSVAAGQVLRNYTRDIIRSADKRPVPPNPPVTAGRQNNLIVVRDGKLAPPALRH